jgi:hypothetical protein
MSDLPEASDHGQGFNSPTLHQLTNMKTIAIDFDGVIHAYTKGWHDGTIYDEPMQGSLDAVKTLAVNNKIVIFSTRAKGDGNLAEMKHWLDKHGFLPFINDITHEKVIASIYIDDRGLRFTDWSNTLDTLTEMNFRSDQMALL